MDGLRDWIPILEGKLAKKAEESVREIGQSLREASESKVQTIDEQPYSLCGGKAGMAVFFAYLAQVWPDQEYERFALRHLEDSLTSLSQFPMSSSLFGGYSGIGWTVQHLQDSVLEIPEEDPNCVIDLGILNLLRESPWRKDYDLVSGLVGLGVYALERLPRPASKECLSRIVDLLDELALRDQDGIAWFTPPELLSPHQHEFAPEGYFNLGLAHGIPGVMTILSATSQHEISPEKSKSLLEGALSWIFSRKLKANRESHFPKLCLKDKTALPPGTRSAWCYGDPGVLAAVHAASVAIGSKEWQNEAVKLALELTYRSDEGFGAMDASLCHGTAGLGQIFNRFFQFTGENEFKRAAQKWFHRTLEMRQAGKGYGGYLTAFPDNQWKPDPGVLTGSAGTGLALLSAVTDIEPRWDRFMLLSFPAKEI